MISGQNITTFLCQKTNLDLVIGNCNVFNYFVWRETVILKALLYSISSDKQLTGVTALKSIVHEVHYRNHNYVTCPLLKIN